MRRKGYSSRSVCLLPSCLHVNVSLLSNFILVGDFNVNLCNSHCPLLLKLQSFISNLYLTQVVSEPTHFSSSSVSLIDLVYLSAPTNLLSCATIPALANSDHLGLCVSIAAGCSKANPKRSHRKIWRYSLANFERACM
jgi:endonuclease/exonuclease/phosphatase family metal-dependent hydrolase